MTLLKACRRIHVTGMAEIVLLSVEERPPLGQVYSVVRYSQVHSGGPNGLEDALGNYAITLGEDDDDEPPCCDAAWVDVLDELAPRLDQVDSVLQHLADGP